ncbi:MAG: DUF2784 domain-containing protein [Steroidobacteraceae bacterium]
MDWKLLADTVVLLHLAFVVFVVIGGFLAWRFRIALFAHVPALLWGIWIELSGWICPLTPLENHLRALAGEAGYTGGFVEHYILPVLYPPGLTRAAQWVLAAVLIALNAIAYGGLLALRRRRPNG